MLPLALSTLSALRSPPEPCFGFKRIIQAHVVQTVQISLYCYHCCLSKNCLIFDRSSPPTFFSTLRTGYLLFTALLKKKDMSWYRSRLARREWPGATGRHACNLSAARGLCRVTGFWKVRGHSGHMHNATEFFFFAHFIVHTWQTSVCKEGGDKALRVNFEGKPGEDSLRPNALCSCSHTCLSMGFSKFASPNLCFQWVLLPRSRKSKQLGYGKMWNSTLGATDKIKLLFSVKLYTGVKLQSIHHECCMCMLLSCQRKPKEKFLRSQSLCN